MYDSAAVDSLITLWLTCLYAHTDTNTHACLHTYRRRLANPLWTPGRVLTLHQGETRSLPWQRSTTIKHRHAITHRWMPAEMHSCQCECVFVFVWLSDVTWQFRCKQRATCHLEVATCSHRKTRKLTLREIISSYFNEIKYKQTQTNTLVSQCKKFVFISAHVPLSINLTFSVLVHINDFPQQWFSTGEFMAWRTFFTL